MRFNTSRFTTAAMLMVALLPAIARQEKVEHAPTGFIPNQGQFVDSEGKSNSAVRFLFRVKGSTCNCAMVVSHTTHGKC